MIGKARSHDRSRPCLQSDPDLQDEHSTNIDHRRPTRVYKTMSGRRLHLDRMDSASCHDLSTITIFDYDDDEWDDLSSTETWMEDDFDRAAAAKVVRLFAAIDASLYEGVSHPDPDVEQECRDWATRFPHLRLIGVNKASTSNHPPPVTIDAGDVIVGGLLMPKKGGVKVARSHSLVDVDKNVAIVDVTAMPPNDEDDDEDNQISKQDYEAVINEMTKLLLPSIVNDVIREQMGRKPVPSRRLLSRSVHKRPILRHSSRRAVDLDDNYRHERIIRFASSQPREIPPQENVSGFSISWWRRNEIATEKHIMKQQLYAPVRLPPIERQSRTASSMPPLSSGGRSTTSKQTRSALTTGETRSLNTAVARSPSTKSNKSRSTIDSAYNSSDGSGKIKLRQNNASPLRRLKTGIT